MEGTEMKILAVTLISLSLFASAALHAQTSTTKAPTSSLIKIVRSDSLQSNKGSAQYFTGSVQVQQLFPANDPSRTSGGKVKFEAGARSAWHTHPFGQILIVMEGTGWIQQWGGPIEEIRKSDVIWIPAGVKHWHGATPNTAMTHIAIQEELNGKAVEWMEQVPDEQYHK
jgi:4-carboxymuconolactone decarboxylase